MRNLLSTSEAAERLHVSRRTVAYMVERGDIEATKVGSGRTASLAFEPDDVERLAAARATRSIAASLSTSREVGSR